MVNHSPLAYAPSRPPPCSCYPIGPLVTLGLANMLDGMSYSGRSILLMRLGTSNAERCWISVRRGQCSIGKGRYGLRFASDSAGGQVSLQQASEIKCLCPCSRLVPAVHFGAVWDQRRGIM